MAFYNDYEMIAQDLGNIAYSTVKAVNLLADKLVAYAGCTLSKYAVVETGLTTTNFAEVVCQGMYIQFTTNASNPTGFKIGVSYTPATTAVAGGVGIGFVNSGYNKIIVQLRIYNTKSGIVAQCLDQSGAWITFFTCGKCTKVSTGETFYAIAQTNMDIQSTRLWVNDTLAIVYYCPYTYSGGPSDKDNVVQILTQAFVTTAPDTNANVNVRYLFTDVYISTKFLQTGVVQIGTRYFFINGNNGSAVELNS